MPAEVRQGALKVPYRKTDPKTGKTVLMSPPFDVQQIKIILGEQAYAALRAGTINGERGSVAHVKAVWRKQGKAIERRQADDSKSVDSPEVLADVAPADRLGSVEVSPASDR